MVSGVADLDPWSYVLYILREMVLYSLFSAEFDWITVYVAIMVFKVEIVLIAA